MAYMIQQVAELSIRSNRGVVNKYMYKNAVFLYKNEKNISLYF